MRHYFHMSNGHITLDDEGTELADLAAVRREAIRAARDLVNVGTYDDFWTGNSWAVWVTDAPNGRGRTVLSIDIKARS